MWTVSLQEVVVLHQEVVDQEVSTAARALRVRQQHTHRAVLTHTHCQVILRQLDQASFDSSTAYYKYKASDFKYLLKKYKKKHVLKYPS